MHTKRGAKRSRRAGALLGAAGTLAGAAYGVLGSVGSVHAAAIDVALASGGVVQVTNPDISGFGANNHGITPFVYGAATAGNFATTGTSGGSPTTPVQLTTIANAPGQTYDAADITDTGNTWNSLEGVTTNLAANTTGVTYILEEQNVPLVDSSGAATGVTLNQYLRLPNGKGTADGLRLFANSTTAGTDGLPNPVNSLNSASTAGDGYGAGASHRELMGTGWSLNGTTEGMGFTLMGLKPSTTYSLYLYSGGSTNGQGGNFTAVSTLLTDVNGNTTGGTATGTAVQTNTTATSNYRSVFDSSGITPESPTAGQSWTLLTLTSDTSGDLSFALTGASAGGVKPILNGFQLDLPASVPEPTSALVLGLGGLGLLGRRRARS